MNTGCSLFSNTVNPAEHLWVLVMQHGGQVATIVENHIGFPRRTVLENGLFNTPLVLRLGLAFPGEDGHATRRNCRRRMVLR